jgi:hypothetical protein
MQGSRSFSPACHHCLAPLTPDEREHYAYECHACVMAEHDLVLTLKTDPDHPDLDRLFSGPVDLGLRLG